MRCSSDASQQRQHVMHWSPAGAWTSWSVGSPHALSPSEHGWAHAASAAWQERSPRRPHQDQARARPLRQHGIHIWRHARQRGRPHVRACPVAAGGQIRFLLRVHQPKQGFRGAAAAAPARAASQGVGGLAGHCGAGRGGNLGGKGGVGGGRPVRHGFCCEEHQQLACERALAGQHLPPAAARHSGLTGCSGTCRAASVHKPCRTALTPTRLCEHRRQQQMWWQRTQGHAAAAHGTASYVSSHRDGLPRARAASAPGPARAPPAGAAGRRRPAAARPAAPGRRPRAAAGAPRRRRRAARLCAAGPAARGGPARPRTRPTRPAQGPCGAPQTLRLGVNAGQHAARTYPPAAHLSASAARGVPVR